MYIHFIVRNPHHSIWAASGNCNRFMTETYYILANKYTLAAAKVLLCHSLPSLLCPRLLLAGLVDRNTFIWRHLQGCTQWHRQKSLTLYLFLPRCLLINTSNTHTHTKYTTRVSRARAIYSVGSETRNILCACMTNVHMLWWTDEQHSVGAGSFYERITLDNWALHVLL